MNARRRRLKGNLKPNHFTLKDDDEHDDQNTSGKTMFSIPRVRVF